MGNDQSFPVKIVLEAVDELTKPLQMVNAQLAKISKPAAQIGGAFVHLGEASGVTQLVSSLKDVRDKTADVGKEAFALGAKLFALGALGAGATFELAKSMAESGREIGETSKLLGVHIGWLQETEFAAARAGLSQEEFRHAMLRFNRNIGEAAAYTGEALIAFRALGIEIRDGATGKLKSLETILPEVSDKLSGIKNEAIRGALAFKLFGREGGNKMLRVLSDGSKGMEEARAHARELGFALGEDGVRDSEEFMKSYRDVEYTLIGLKNAIGSALLPAVQEAMDKFVEFIGSHREQVKKFADEFADRIPDIVDAIASAADGAWTALKRVGAAIGWVSDLIGPANTAMLGIALTIGFPLVSSIASLTVALGKLCPMLVTTTLRLGSMMFGPILIAFKDLFSLIMGGTPILEAFNLVLACSPIGLIAGIIALGVAIYELIVHWDFVKKCLLSLWGVVENVFSGWRALLIPVLTPVGLLGAAAFELIEHWGAVKSWFGSFWEYLKNIFSGWGALLLPLTGPIALIGVAGYQLIKQWESVKSWFISFWDFMKNLFNDGVASVLGVIDQVKDALGFSSGAKPFTANVNSSLGPATGTQQLISAISPGNQSYSRQETALKVSFENMPKGTRISTEKSSETPVELFMGYAMVNP